MEPYSEIFTGKTAMLRLAFTFSLLTLSMTVLADGYYIKNDRIVCDSEKQYRDQIKHLVDGNRSLIRGCEINYGDTPIALVDANLHGPSKVEILMTGRIVWTESEFIGKSD